MNGKRFATRTISHRRSPRLLIGFLSDDWAGGRDLLSFLHRKRSRRRANNFAPLQRQSGQNLEEHQCRAATVHRDPRLSMQTNTPCFLAIVLLGAPPRLGTKPTTHVVPKRATLAPTWSIDPVRINDYFRPAKGARPFPTRVRPFFPSPVLVTADLDG